MPTKAFAIAVAGAGAMLLFASAWAASDDEFRTADDLVLPGQPAGDDMLMKQSGSAAPPVILNTNNIQQDQKNTITIMPVTMNTSITKTSSTEVINDDSIASITSSASATIIHGGQQTP